MVLDDEFLHSYIKFIGYVCLRKWYAVGRGAKHLSFSCHVESVWSWVWPVKYESNGGASILNIWNIGTVTFNTDSGMDLYYGGNLVDSDSSATGVPDQTSPRVNIARYNNSDYFMT